MRAARETSGVLLAAAGGVPPDRERAPAPWNWIPEIADEGTTVGMGRADAASGQMHRVGGVATLTERGPTDAPTVATATGEGAASRTFDDLYKENLSFAWRNVRRLGIPDEMVDDVVQDVFIIAYRRLSSFGGSSTPRTWLFGILRRVVRDRRRTYARTHPLSPEDVQEVADHHGASPLDSLEQRRASQLVHQLLESLSDERREVFVLAELEGMTAPEIAQATGSNLNTVYARLRMAREEFKAAMIRWQARQPRRRP